MFNAYANHIWAQVCWTGSSTQAWLIRNAESTAPFLSFNHWTQASWVCVCVCAPQCVNALLRLLAFIYLVSYSTTPSSNFILLVLRFRLIPPYPFSTSLWVLCFRCVCSNRLTDTQASWIIHLRLHQGELYIWLVHVITHSLSFMLDSFTDVTQTHTQSVLPLSLLLSFDKYVCVWV